MQLSKKAIDLNNSIYAFKQQSLNAEFRSSIWLLSVHGWFFKSNPALKSYINKQMRCDFITLYKREYIDKFIKDQKKSSKKKNISPYLIPNEEEYYAQFLKGRHRVYVPIITNYFTEFDSGHKDFVRSFVHLDQ